MFESSRGGDRRPARVLALIGLGVLVGTGACGGKKHGHAHDDAAVAAARDAATADAGPAPVPARSEHAVWELVPNRHTAHRAVDGEVVIDASDIGFARYIRFGMPVPRWHLGKMIDGERAAVADRLASIDVPLSHAQTRATQLTLRIHGSAKQSITVKLNGRAAKHRKAATVQLDPGWQTLAVPLEPDHLVRRREPARVRDRRRGRRPDRVRVAAHRDVAPARPTRIRAPP